MSRRDFVLAGLALFLPLVIIVACASARQDAAGLSYESQHLACIDQYETRAAIDACRNDVRRRWGRLDAGPPAPPSARPLIPLEEVYPSDAGGDR
jgi:hypothetical protein